MIEAGSALAGVKLTLVDSTEEVSNFLSWLGERRPVLGIDTETSGLSLPHDHIRMAQFGDAMHGWAIPYQDWRGLVAEVMDRYEGPRVLHHAKFDAGMLERDGIPFDWKNVHDTLPMCFLNNSMGPKSLKGASRIYVDPAAATGQKELKAAFTKNRWDWGSVPIDFLLYWGYAALDPVLTARLAENLWPRIQPYREAYDLEMATARVLTAMELKGARIDLDYCSTQMRDLKYKLEGLRAQLGDLNPFAPRQVADALAASGAELTKLTDAGQLAVDDDVLGGIAESQGMYSEELKELAQLVRDARGTDKLISAYFGNFLEQRDGDILHPHINQLAARTGRMSVSEPALQQVPKNSFVRDAFIPREGNKLILADYDNEELRVAAHFCQDANMIEAFEQGRDLHMETAIRVYGEVDGPHKRSNGKRAMFSKAYGAGIDKFARTIGVPNEEAKRIFDAIEAVYPGLVTGMARATAVVRERAAANKSEFGYVVLTDGRRIMVKTAKAYVGFNALIQGNCALVAKRSLVDLDAAGLGDALVLSIHDENMLEVPEADAEEAARLVETVMGRDDWRIPLTVSATIADRWGDLYREAA